MGRKAWLDRGRGRGCPLSKEKLTFITQKETGAQSGVTGRHCTGVGVAPRPNLPKVPVMPGGHWPRSLMLPEAPDGELPLPVSSPSATTGQQNSLGWLRAPVPTLKDAAEMFRAEEMARRERELGSKVGAGQTPRQAGRKE